MDGESTKLLEFVRVGGVLTSVLVLAGTWFVARLLAATFDRLGQRFTDRRLLFQQVGTFLRFFVYLGGIAAAALLSFHLSDQALLALGGTIAVTVGFALKDLAASILAGLTILIDKPFQVGDRVTFAGHYGEIRAIGLRSVQLVTLDDNVVTIPNNQFLTEVVACANAGALDMLVQLDFHIGMAEDLQRAKRIVREAITSSPYAYLRKPWRIRVRQVIEDGYVAIRLRAKVYVLDVRYQQDMETDITERVLEGFAADRIAPPTAFEEERSLRRVADRDAA